MATDQLSPPRGRPLGGDAKLVQYDEYIDKQVESTRRMVKVVDLATSLVVLMAWLLAFLLAAAVAEHWLVPGGFPVAIRGLLFAILAGGVIWFAYRRLWPLFVHRINPVYAAQSIERSGPSLKNTLVNLLLFRQHRSEISDAVYRTLEEQAAQRLSRVPVEGAVDRSLLIRFGYVLLAIVAVASLYTVLSPKNPLVTVQRVLMPWADIVPASRVQIRGIEPGSVTVSRGESISISADVRGIGDDDVVLLRYTTTDGRAVDKPVPMRPAEGGLRFAVRLPDGGAANDTGLAQNLVYRIEAGDARSLDYRVTVVPSPSILVERVEYDYPAYTGYEDDAVEDLGDIHAIEGTRVTVHARANGPIREAHVDFDADGRRDLLMSAGENAATASFVLSLREDRQTPQHASYVLRFANAEGRSNRDPAKHSIKVDPDRAPEAAILAPQEDVLDIRLDETVAIEVEAREPDFLLSEVRLHGESAGRVVIDEPLPAAERQRRFTGRYQFSPTAHDLRAGDVVQYWVTANDNRAPEPNNAASDRKQIRIVAPDPAKQPPPNQVAQRDQQKGGQPDKEQQQQPGQKGGEQQQGEGGEGQQGEQQQPQDGQQPGEQVSREAQPSADEQQGEGQGQGDKETGKQGESGGTPQEGGEAGEGAQSEAGKSESKPDQQKSNGKQTGAPRSGGESSQQDASPDGARADGEPSEHSQQPSSGSKPNDGRSKPGDPSDRPSEQTPVSSEGDNDAEAFERIQRHLEKNGELKDGESATSADDSANDVSREAQPSAKQAPEDTDTGRQGDKGKGESKQGEQTTGEQADSQQAAEQPGAGDQKGKRADDQGEGQGAETKSDDLNRPEESPQGEQDQTKSPGGEQTSSKGESGAGEEQESQGAPNSQPEMKPGEKQQPSASAEKKTDQTEPAAGARGKKESDSHGEQGGDRAGGGEEGGGQDAPREGTGSAGQNQSAEEGAGESTEEGGGETSSKPGDDAAADEQTGQSAGEKKGGGSKQRDGEGKKTGGEAGGEDSPARDKSGNEAKSGESASADGEQRSAEPRQGDKETGRQGEQDTGKQADEQKGDSGKAKRGADAPSQSGEGGTPTGEGGQKGTAANPASQQQGTAPDGDAANLEYARKQTDLVLDKLADQMNRKKVDDKLLKDLGWSEEDLRKFVERWKARKESAQRHDPVGEASQRELDEALRSLGLRRGPIQQEAVKEDSLRDLREGYRGPVPRAYQDRLRAYNQGVSKSREKAE